MKSKLENLDYKFPFGIPVSSSFPQKYSQHRKEIKNGIKLYGFSFINMSFSSAGK